MFSWTTYIWVKTRKFCVSLYFPFFVYQECVIYNTQHINLADQEKSKDIFARHNWLCFIILITKHKNLFKEKIKGMLHIIVATSIKECHFLICQFWNVTNRVRVLTNNLHENRIRWKFAHNSANYLRLIDQGQMGRQTYSGNLTYDDGSN